MSRERRQEMVDRNIQALGIHRPAMCLVGHQQIECLLSAHPIAALMKQIDQQYLAKTPFYGSSAPEKSWLGRQDHWVNREAGPTSDADLGTASHLPAAPDQQAGAGARYPYLLGDGEPDPTRCGHRHHLHTHGPLYLVAIMDWYSRYVVAWKLSNTLGADFCRRNLGRSTGQGKAGGLQHRPREPVHQWSGFLNFWRSTGSGAVSRMGKAGTDNILVAQRRVDGRPTGSARRST